MRRTGNIALGTLLLAAFLAAGSCRRSYPRPRGLIGEEEMIGVLVDVHLAEAILMNEESLGSNVDSLSPIVMARVFHKHQVSREQFDKSLDYYSHDPDRLNQMYEQVYNTVTRYDAEMKAQASAAE